MTMAIILGLVMCIFCLLLVIILKYGETKSKLYQKAYEIELIPSITSNIQILDNIEVVQDKEGFIVIKIK